MKAKNIVEINGKLYDADTGQLLHASAQKALASKAIKASQISNAKTKAKATNKSLDGLSARPTPITQSVQDHSKMDASKHNTPVGNRSLNKAGFKAEKSTTLHRRAVKAPVVQSIATESKAAPANSPTVSPKASYIHKKIDPKRTERLQRIERSSSISKFSAEASSLNVGKKTPTRPLPQEKIEPKLTSENFKKEDFSKIDNKTAATPSLHQSFRLMAPTEENVQTPQATKGFSMLKRYATLSAVILIIGGYVAYLNIPSISMRVAANRAGFSASLPGYTPAGYSLNGPIAYSPGVITINFASRTDERRFSLSQKPTTWDSTALLENMITKESKDYTTYQDRGLTIYVYNEGNAAWINGGKLYQVDGKDAHLGADQILDIATSI